MGETEFLQIFGDVTISDIFLWIFAIGYLVPKLKQFYSWSRKYWSKTEKREKAIENAEKLEVIREQTVQERSRMDNRITAIEESLKTIIERLDKRDKADQEKRLNKTYSQIIQMYQFYASEERNPLQAWTAMEADAFWKIIRDYEDDGGDGYVHTEIVPPMRQLLTIEMSDREDVQKLMQSRR